MMTLTHPHVKHFQRLKEVTNELLIACLMVGACSAGHCRNFASRTAGQSIAVKDRKMRDNLGYAQTTTEMDCIVHSSVGVDVRKGKRWCAA